MASDWQVEDRHNLLTHHFRIGNRATSDCRPHRDSVGITKIRRSISLRPGVNISGERHRRLPFDVWLSIGFVLLIAFLWISPFGAGEALLKSIAQWCEGKCPHIHGGLAGDRFSSAVAFGIPVLAAVIGAIISFVLKDRIVFYRLNGIYVYIVEVLSSTYLNTEIRNFESGNNPFVSAILSVIIFNNAHFFTFMLSNMFILSRYRKDIGLILFTILLFIGFFIPVAFLVGSIEGNRI